MKVLYKKGVAIILAPSDAPHARKDGGEAFTGERPGEVLSLETPESSGMPTPLNGAEGNSGGLAIARGRRPAGSETLCTVGSSAHGNREILRQASHEMAARSARESARSTPDDSGT